MRRLIDYRDLPYYSFDALVNLFYLIYWKGFMDLIGLEKRIHRDCLFLWNSDVFHYDLRGDLLRMGLCGNAGCLN